jgi:predicted Zn-dependent protease
VNRSLAFLLLLVAVFAGWRVYSSVKPVEQVEQSSATKTPSAKPGAQICFVPLDDFPVDQLEGLRTNYRQKYDVEISISKPVLVQPDLRDSSRRQFRAEDLAASLRSALPEFDKNTILIGFTSEDIYPVSQDWRFAFGWRSSATTSAVVSTARLSLPYAGLPASAERSSTRLRKIVTKDIGIFYFGLPQSSNPKSVLYNQIMGIEELDNVGEDF